MCADIYRVHQNLAMCIVCLGQASFSRPFVHVLVLRVDDVKIRFSIIKQSPHSFSRICRIVLENSGVAEPHNIRELFSDAEEGGHPLLSRVRLDTLVTVVDAHTFGGHPRP